MGVDLDQPFHRFKISFKTTEGDLVEKRVGRLNLMCKSDNKEQFLLRRKLALELREIYQSVIKYLQEVNSYIESNEESEESDILQ